MSGMNSGAMDEAWCEQECGGHPTSHCGDDGEPVMGDIQLVQFLQSSTTKLQECVGRMTGSSVDLEVSV